MGRPGHVGPPGLSPQGQQGAKGKTGPTGQAGEQGPTGRPGISIYDDQYFNIFKVYSISHVFQFLIDLRI